MSNTEAAERGAEREARDLRLELGKLREAEKALEGLVLVDPGEQGRLDRVGAEIRRRVSRLGDLGREARS